MLAVSGGFPARNWGSFPLSYHLGADFDHGKTKGPAVLPPIGLPFTKARGLNPHTTNPNH